MKSFLKAFLFFLCWAALALYTQTNKNEYRFASVKKDTDSYAPTPPASNKKDSITFIENDTINKTTDTTFTLKKRTVSNKNIAPIPFVFEDKFITNADHKRVILLKKFYYFKDSIFNFLANNTTEEVTINAYYLPSETLSDSDNFGIERAATLKSKLVQYGVNPIKINCKAIEKEYSYDKEGYYADGIFITHNTIAAEKLKIVNEDIANKSFFVANLKPKSIPRALEFYAAEAREYLKDKPTKNLVVIGETSSQKTKVKALIRAEKVAKFLINKGIDSTRISIENKEIKQPQKTNIVIKVLSITEQ